MEPANKNAIAKNSKNSFVCLVSLNRIRAKQDNEGYSLNDAFRCVYILFYSSLESCIILILMLMLMIMFTPCNSQIWPTPVIFLLIILIQLSLLIYVGRQGYFGGSIFNSFVVMIKTMTWNNHFGGKRGKQSRMWTKGGGGGREAAKGRHKSYTDQCLMGPAVDKRDMFTSTDTHTIT